MKSNLLSIIRNSALHMNERSGLLLSASLLLFAVFMMIRNRDGIAQGGTALIDYAGDVIDSGVTYMQNLTRGERNNNPGNIRKSAIFWRGETAGNDRGFESFDKPEDGIRAIAVLVQNYQKKYGLNTVRGIINRYAPPTENNTSAYVAAVASALDVSPDAALNLSDPDTLLALVTAIIKHENGRVIYAQGMIAGAIGIA